jgi:hypothetical protein
MSRTHRSGAIEGPETYSVVQISTISPSSFGLEISATKSVQKSGANVRSPPIAVCSAHRLSVCLGVAGDHRPNGCVRREAVIRSVTCRCLFVWRRDSQKETYGTGEAVVLLKPQPTSARSVRRASVVWRRRSLGGFVCKEVKLETQVRDGASVDGRPASHDNKNHGDQRA